MEIKLKIGEKCTIKLVENYTTGWSWDFDKGQSCVVVNESIVSDDVAIGGPCTVFVTFEAVKVGKVVYSFMRKWLDNDIPVKQIVVKVI